MASQSSFSKIRGDLTNLQSSGQQSVEIPALLQYLEHVEQDAPLDIELLRMHQEAELARMKVNEDARVEEFRSVIETAKVALTTAILVNGGASVALLALLGNLLSKSQTTSPQVPAALVNSLSAFALGVLLGAIATGTTYLTQYCYHMEFRRSAAGFHISTVSLVLATYAAFLVGVVFAYHGFIA